MIASILYLFLSTLNFPYQNIDNEILDEWGIYVIESNGTKDMCNACPTLILEDNTNAILKIPSGEIQRYSWIMVNNTLSLKRYDSNESKSYFSNEDYTLELLDKGKYFELSLLAMSGEKYILRKTKSEDNGM